MKRFLATLHVDVRLQMRNGLYAAVLFVTLMMAFAANRLQGAAAWLLPPLVLNNLVLISFYAAAALWLLEDDEGTHVARAASPLRTGEYLAARGLSLGLLALAQSIGTGWALTNGAVNIVALSAGSLAAALILCWSGLAVVTRFDSLNTFLLPSIPLAAALLLPVIGHVLGWPLWALAWHPLQGPLVLLQAATTSTDTPLMLYALAAATLWCALSFAFALSRSRSMVV
jgi:hypothetical protein